MINKSKKINESEKFHRKIYCNISYKIMKDLVNSIIPIVMINMGKKRRKKRRKIANVSRNENKLTS